MFKRIKILSISFLVIMGLLIFRLAYIQIIGHEDLSAAAEMQQNIVLEGADTRSVIYDRNGTPIAGSHQDYIYIIPAEKYDGETQNALNKVEAVEVPNETESYKVYVSQEYDKKTGDRLIKNSDAYILEADRRYMAEQPAVHMIGYVNHKDGSGASGLELMYDKELSLYNKKVMAPDDVSGKLMRGYGLTVQTASDDDIYIKDGITTTLELGTQKEIERILAECDKDGAIVVLKADTGEIIAAASTPVFDPSQIEAYMESDNGEFINKVTQGTYPPGSVFKIVVAAAALEAGVMPDKTFMCTGNENINGHTVKCETGGEAGHGKITLKKAFADSCNCAFIQLGKIVGAEAVLAMAERMGLGKTVLEEFPEEQTGNLMTLQNAKGAAIANLSIGQGEILVTPLQIASMTAIIADDVIDPGIKIITGETEGEQCIAQETADELHEMMEETIISGTGKGLELPVSAGAKTGSAESVQNGRKVIHGWMTGYVPAESPQYVITVFTENGRSGRASAGPVFSQVVNHLYENGLLEYETAF